MGVFENIVCNGAAFWTPLWSRFNIYVCHIFLLLIAGLILATTRWWARRICPQKNLTPADPSGLGGGAGQERRATDQAGGLLLGGPVVVDAGTVAYGGSRGKCWPKYFRRMVLSDAVQLQTHPRQAGEFLGTTHDSVHGRAHRIDAFDGGNGLRLPIDRHVAVHHGRQLRDALAQGVDEFGGRPRRIYVNFWQINMAGLMGALRPQSPALLAAGAFGGNFLFKAWAVKILDGAAASDKCSVCFPSCQTAALLIRKSELLPSQPELPK